MQTLPSPVPAPARTHGRRLGLAYRAMVLAFVAVLLAAELGARAVGVLLPEPTTWYHDIAQAKVEQLDDLRGAELDLVFAGTSQTYYGVDAALVDRRLGTSSYNAGVPAGVPPIQERWLLREVLGRVDANTVVWGLSLLDLNDSRDLSPVQAYDEAFATRPGTLADLDRRLARWSALFRHRRQLVDPEAWRSALGGQDAMAHSRSLLRSDGVRVPGGRSPTERQRRRIQNQVLADYRLGREMVDSVRSTVGELEAGGVEVVLVWLPVPPRLLDLLDDPSVEPRARRAVRRLAAELEVELVDLGTGFTDDDFVDYTHLGPGGARQLSRRLAAALRPHAGPVVEPVSN